MLRLIEEFTNNQLMTKSARKALANLKATKKPKRPAHADVNQAAFRVVQERTKNK